MKTYQKLLLFIIVALAAAALLSPWIFTLWNSFAAAPRHRAAFEQIFGGVFIAAGVVLVLASPSLLRLRFLRDAGVAARGQRNVLCGVILALASMAVLGVVMYLSRSLTPGLSDPIDSIVRASAKALMTALMVGFLEELFFRGILFQGLLKDSGAVVAFVAANLIYSASHFFKPPEDFIAAGIDPLAGLRFLGLCLTPFLDPPRILPGLIGLFIIGVVLSYALLRTDSLYLSIGLHTGWVFGIKMLPFFGEFTRDDLGLAFGAKPKVVSGVVTWVGILLVGVIVHFTTRKRA